jgi:hypothetical protein
MLEYEAILLIEYIHVPLSAVRLKLSFCAAMLVTNKAVAAIIPESFIFVD